MNSIVFDQHAWPLSKILRYKFPLCQLGESGWQSGHDNHASHPCKWAEPQPILT